MPLVRDRSSPSQNSGASALPSHRPQNPGGSPWNINPWNISPWNFNSRSRSLWNFSPPPPWSQGRAAHPEIPAEHRERCGIPGAEERESPGPEFPGPGRSWDGRNPGNSEGAARAEPGGVELRLGMFLRKPRPQERMEENARGDRRGRPRPWGPHSQERMEQNFRGVQRRRPRPWGSLSQEKQEEEEEETPG